MTMAVAALNLAIFAMDDKFRFLIPTYLPSIINGILLKLEMSAGSFRIAAANIPATSVGIWNNMM